MIFKAKLRVIGNSQGVYIPKSVITEYKIGEVITLEVITGDKPKEVITEKKGLVFNMKKGICERK